MRPGKGSSQKAGSVDSPGRPSLGWSQQLTWSQDSTDVSPIQSPQRLTVSPDRYYPISQMGKVRRRELRGHAQGVSRFATEL